MVDTIQPREISADRHGEFIMPTLNGSVVVPVEAPAVAVSGPAPASPQAVASVSAAMARRVDDEKRRELDHAGVAA